MDFSAVSVVQGIMRYVPCTLCCFQPSHRVFGKWGRSALANVWTWPIADSSLDSSFGAYRFFLTKNDRFYLIYAGSVFIECVFRFGDSLD